MTQVNVLETLGSATEELIDQAVGTGAIALDIVRRPSRSRRRGAQVTEQVVTETGTAIDEVLGLPERMFIAYLRGVRRQARRADVVGVVSRGILGVVNTPASNAAGFFARVERETTVETGRRRPTAARGARQAASAVRKAARATTGAAKTTRKRNAAGKSTAAVSRRGASTRRPTASARTRTRRSA